MPSAHATLLLSDECWGWQLCDGRCIPGQQPLTAAVAGSAAAASDACTTSRAAQLLPPASCKLQAAAAAPSAVASFESHVPGASSRC